MPYEIGDGSGRGSGDGCGRGNGDGWGWGSGWGDGSGWSSGEGSGYGWGDGWGWGSGSTKERKKIELNILENIPKEELLLYMHGWEFEETKWLLEERLKEGFTCCQQTLLCSRPSRDIVNG
jgi:hypothetical protein